MKSIKKRATLHDVADAAGVSYQTVSRVINNSPSVSSETRKRVLHIIRELDYIPNRAARMLSTRRSHTIQVMTLNVWISGSEMLYGMINAAEGRSYQVTVSALHPENLRAAIKTADRRLVDGFILVNPMVKVDEALLLSVEHAVPLVQIGGSAGGSVPSVMYDQTLGGRLAAQHFIELGHTRVAEIRGPEGLWDAVGRHEGWVSVLHSNNITADLSVYGDFTARGGYQGINALLEKGSGKTPPFTALFAANDNTALGAILALREHGLRVPEDVSVIGFDDTLNSAYFSPPLTTIKQDFALLGRLAVEHLLSFIEEPDIPVYQRVIQPQLIIRQSTRKL
jgi:LacI family transcriptional regulator